LKDYDNKYFGTGIRRTPYHSQQSAKCLFAGRPPTLEQRRGDLKKFKSAMIARRSEIEEAINSDH